MKKLLLVLVAFFSFSVYNAMCDVPGVGTCPACPVFGSPASGACPETAIGISSCGAAFTITQAQMLAATPGNCCDFQACANGSYCSIDTGGCFSADDYDCNTATASGGGSGDDFSGTTENTQWWEFVASESCPLTLQMCNSNCTNTKAGSCTQYNLYGINGGGTLPTNTINDVYGTSSNWCGCTTITFTPDVGERVMLAVDGNSGADCDVAVTLTPDASCSGCVIVLNRDPSLNFRVKEQDKDNVLVMWNNLIQIDEEYSLERSINGKNFEIIHNITSSELMNSFVDSDVILGQDYYYRLKKFDSKSNKLSPVGIDAIKLRDYKHSVNRYFDIQGREYTNKSDFKGGIVITVTEFPDGEIETLKEWISE